MPEAFANVELVALLSGADKHSRTNSCRSTSILIPGPYVTIDHQNKKR